MKKSQVKYSRGGNKAKAFGLISNKLIQLAPQYGLTPSEIILDFISDLENMDNEGYEKRIDKISVSGLTQFATNDLINYLRKIYSAERKKEIRDIQVEQHQIDMQEYRTQYISDVWGKICEGAGNYIKACEDEFLDTSDSYPRAWINVFEKIDSVLRKITSHDKIPDYLRTEILKRVEDEIYYNEIKYFTEDFKFLAGIPDAGRVSSYGRRFIRYDDNSYKKMYNRYLDLREAIPVTHEEPVIRKMLSQNDIDAVTKRILNSRLEYIERKKYEAEHGNVGITTGEYAR